MHIPSLTAASILLATCISFVNANAAVTAPVLSKWKAGSKHIITWQEDNKEPPMAPKFAISLMRGDRLALQLVSTIEKDVDSSSGQYTWDIPAGQEPGSDYAIRLGNSPDYVYSDYFEILPAGEVSSSSSPESTSTSEGTSSIATPSSSEATNGTSETPLSTSTPTEESQTSTDITPNETSSASASSSAESTDSAPSKTPGVDESGSSIITVSFVSTFLIVGSVVSQLFM